MSQVVHTTVPGIVQASAPKDLDHDVGLDDLSDACNIQHSSLDARPNGIVRRITRLKNDERVS